MATYVILGHKQDKCALTLTTLAGIKQSKKIDPKLVIKKKFDAPSWEVAKVVYDHFNGFLKNPDTFIKQLAKYYGYKISK